MGILDVIRPKRKSPKDITKNVNVPEAKRRLSRRGATVPMFEDMPTLSEPKAYSIIYEQDTTFSPLQKTARKCGAFKSMIVGGGERGKMMQQIVDQGVGMKVAQEWMFYAIVEGWRGLWLKAIPKGRFNVLNLFGSGGKKLNAGGNWWWGGWDDPTVIKMSPINSYLPDESVLCERERVCIFCPTADVNPEGDTRMAQNSLRVAYLTSLLDVAEQVYTERHSLPKEIIKKVMSELDPLSVESALQAGLDELAGASALKNFTLDSKEALEIVETSGRTWQFLQALRASLNGRGHKLVTGENLTSDSSDSGDTGSSELADKQLFGVAAYIMSMMSEAFTMQVLPFLEEVNKHILPPALKKDPPMVWVFVPPIEKQRLSPAETFGAMDREYPLTYGFISQVLGTGVPPGKNPDDIFVIPSKMRAAQAVEEAGMMPSSTGEGRQRPDREVPGSGMPPEDKQDKQTDKRNLDKEAE